MDDQGTIADDRDLHQLDVDPGKLDAEEISLTKLLLKSFGKRKFSLASYKDVRHRITEYYTELLERRGLPPSAYPR